MNIIIHWNYVITQIQGIFLSLTSVNRQYAIKRCKLATGNYLFSLRFRDSSIWLAVRIENYNLRVTMLISLVNIIESRWAWSITQMLMTRRKQNHIPHMKRVSRIFWGKLRQINKIKRLCKQRLMRRLSSKRKNQKNSRRIENSLKKLSSKTLKTYWVERRKAEMKWIYKISSKSSTLKLRLLIHQATLIKWKEILADYS